MITKDIGDINFEVKVVPTFYERGSQKIQTGFAIVDDNGMPIRQYEEKDEVLTNSELISLAEILFGDAKFSHAYYRNRRSYFHIFLKLNAVKDELQHGLELINSYDGKALPKINFCFYDVRHDSWIYTGLPATMGILRSDTTLEDIRVNVGRDWSRLITEWQSEEGYVLGSLDDVPKYINIPKSLYHSEIETRYHYYRYCGLIAKKWSEKSFELARNWLARTIQINH